MKRNINISVLKCIAIFFVVYTHFAPWHMIDSVTTGFEYALNSIAAVAVPIFFIINGYFLLDKSLDLNKHLKKTIHLGVVVFLWGLVNNLVFGVVYGFPEKLDFLSNIEFGICDIPGQRITNWFFYALLGIYVLFPFIKLAFDYSKKYLLIFAGYIFIMEFGSAFLYKIFNILIWIFDFNVYIYERHMFFSRDYFLFQNGWALLYFIIGGLIHKYEKQIEERIKDKKRFCFILVIIGLMINYLYGILHTFMEGKRYNNVFDSYNSIAIFTVSTVLFVIFLQKKIQCSDSVKKIVFLIEKNTFGIYFIHLVVGYLLNIKFGMYRDILFGFPYVIFLFCISLLLSWIISVIPIINKMTKL